MALRRGVEAAGRAACDALQMLARPVDTEEALTQVAAVSCQDEALARLVGQACFAVGREGVVTVDDAQKQETTVEIRQGIVLERGFLAPEMTTNEEKTAAELDDPRILLCDSKLDNVQEILPALIACAEDGCDLLIICEALSGDARSTILRTDMDGDIKIVCIEAPLYGEPGLEPETCAWPRSIISVLTADDCHFKNLLDDCVKELGCEAPELLSVSDVEDQDWVRITQAQFQPSHVSPRLWIVPSWSEPPVADALNVRLDPGVAFGTGSHPTTRLCLNWLDENIKSADRVLDYGCGTGILAIGARSSVQLKSAAPTLTLRPLRRPATTPFEMMSKLSSGCRPTCLRAHSQSWSPTFWPIR